MIMFYLRKTAELIITVVLISIITFCAFHILPGDPALVLLGVDADSVQIENLHKALDLDKPVAQQYTDWIFAFLKGNFGYSFKYRRPVRKLISNAFSVTAKLTVFVLLLTLAIGIPVGFWLALHDKAQVSIPVSVTVQIGISVPSFCAALFFIFVFSVKMHLLPSMGYVKWSENQFLCIQSLLLPAMSIAFGTSSVLIRYMRSSVLSQLDLDYVRTERSKGLPFGKIMLFHVLRNSLVPVITIFGMLTAEILGGSIIVENVFSLPGIGKLLAESILSRDFPLIQGLVLYIAAIVVICNFAVDMLYSIIDPRIRTRKEL